MDKQKENKKVIRVAMYCRMARDNDAEQKPAGAGKFFPGCREGGAGIPPEKIG